LATQSSFGVSFSSPSGYFDVLR